MAPAGTAPSLSGAIASEKAVVEVPAVELLQSLGWQHGDLMQEELGAKNPTGRLSFREVILPARLRAALRRLNPALPEEALRQAEAKLTEDRSAMLPVAANREVHRLLRDGVPVELRQPDGSLKPDRVRLVDWTNPATNDFFLASQAWITSDLYKRRPDSVGFVNGIPLLLCEWKAPTQPVQEAYDANLTDYRDTIPRLFDPNGFTVLSNGLEALMGPSHAPFDVFAPWKRLEEEGPESVGLETLLRGTCEPTRFLDLVENFLIFEDARGGLRKVTAKYHQVLGVNRAIEAVQKLEENRGRLGVFWHTQGSGKSLSMVMFAEKVLLPDDRATPYLKPVAVVHVIAEAIRGKLGPVDISAVSAQIEALLDQRVEGVAITAPIIPGDDRGGRVDLTEIDFEKLAKLFQSKPKTANEKLRTAAEDKARDLASRNPTRVHLVEKLEALVEAYNLGTLDAEAFFAALKKLIAEMEEEERRAAREGLTDEELTIFDLLTRPEPKLTKAQAAAVKKVARELLEKLQELRGAFWRQGDGLRQRLEARPLVVPLAALSAALRVAEQVCDAALMLVALRLVPQAGVCRVPEGVHPDALAVKPKGLAVVDEEAGEAGAALSVLPLRLQVRKQRIVHVRRDPADVVEEAAAQHLGVERDDTLGVVGLQPPAAVLGDPQEPDAVLTIHVAPVEVGELLQASTMEQGQQRQPELGVADHLRSAPCPHGGV